MTVFEPLVALGEAAGQAFGEVEGDSREAPREVALTTVEAQAVRASGLGFFVAGTGFEPVTSGL
jgi:hypothetical protein